MLMNVRLLTWSKYVLLILGWGTSTAALTLATIFQGLLLPRNINGGGLYSEVVSSNPIWLVIFYLGNLTICLVAAMAISDVSRALVSFFASFLVAAGITDLVLALPDFLGIFPFPGALQEAATIFTLTAFFPVLLLVNFAGTILGISLAERYLG